MEMCERESKSVERSEEKKKLVQELIDMGFSQSAVLQVISITLIKFVKCLK